jgi:hypothetical protein
MTKFSSVPTKKDETNPLPKGKQGNTSEPELQSSDKQRQSESPSKRNHGDAPKNEHQPTSSSKSSRSDPIASTTPSVATGVTAEDITAKRIKREWLSYGGVKRTRVGSAYQVAVLPSAGATANDATSAIGKASSMSKKPTTSPLPK